MRPKPNASPDDVAFGVNAVAMALQAGAVRSLVHLEGTRNPRVLELAARAKELGLATLSADLRRLDELSGGGVHQGVLARLKAFDGIDLRAAVEAPGAGLVLMLDSITDPQNVGAILRTAVAVAAKAVVLPRRRGAQLTPGVHRASAGLSFIAPVAAPQNLAQAVEIVKERGYWVVAAGAGPGAASALTFDWPNRTALVLGSEAEGVSHLLRARSDFQVALPMDGRVDSLNVGVACGALCYLYRRQWPG
jgi:23S rRNA (guanosine2251-2'-O)-methyltransferase